MTYRRPANGSPVRLRVARAPVDRRSTKRSALLDRDLDVREHVDFLRLAVFEHLEVFSREAGDEIALLVGHDDVDVDVVHLDLEGDRRWLLRVLRLDDERRVCRTAAAQRVSAMSSSVHHSKAYDVTVIRVSLNDRGSSCPRGLGFDPQQIPAGRHVLQGNSPRQPVRRPAARPGPASGIAHLSRALNTSCPFRRPASQPCRSGAAACSNYCRRSRQRPSSYRSGRMSGGSIAGPGSSFGAAGSGMAVIAACADAAVMSSPLNINGLLPEIGHLQVVEHRADPTAERFRVRRRESDTAGLERQPRIDAQPAGFDALVKESGRSVRFNSRPRRRAAHGRPG